MELERHESDAVDTAAKPIRLGLVGRGIARSRTPAMHETEAAAQGLACRYVLLDSDDPASGPASGAPLSDILDWAEAEGFAGLNVTYPYKQDVMGLLNELSDAARRVGAVNTIVFRNGRRFGHNTDFWGFSESLRQGLPEAQMDAVLLIGAGGAGGAVAHALSDLGTRTLLIADARTDAAEGLVAAIRASGGNAEVVSDLAIAAARANGLVNATPIGMAKLPGTPLDPDLIAPRHWVADIVYFPLETAFLRAARDRGCATLGGEGMAVFQAVRAFELFTGRPADAGRVAATFRSLGDR